MIEAGYQREVTYLWSRRAWWTLSSLQILSQSLSSAAGSRYEFAIAFGKRYTLGGLSSPQWTGLKALSIPKP